MSTARRIRWGSILLASVSVWVLGFVVIAATIFAYAVSLGIAARGAPEPAAIQRFASTVGQIWGPRVGILCTGVAAVWLGRRMTARPVAHGVLMGLVVGGTPLAVRQSVAVEPILTFCAILLVGVVGGWLGGHLTRNQSTTRPLVTGRTMSEGAGLACGECGEQILHDERDGRRPCPSCGSLTRTLSIVGSGGLSLSGSAEIEAVAYPEVLIAWAQRFVEGRESGVAVEFGVAVIVAHMASEVATARLLSRALRVRGLPELEEPIEQLISSYNLANDRVRALYQALIGDCIHKHEFWKEFKKSAQRRNRIVHRGEPVSQADAQAGVEAARHIVSHLLNRERQLAATKGAA